MSDETYYPRHASLPVELLRKPEQFDTAPAIERLSLSGAWGLCAACGNVVQKTVVLPQVSAVGQ